MLCLSFITPALAANSQCNPGNNLQRCFLSPSQLATPYCSSFLSIPVATVTVTTSPISWVVSCRECRRCYSFVSAISLSQRQFLLGQMLPFQRNFWLHTPKWSSRQRTQSVSCVLFIFPSFFTFRSGLLLWKCPVGLKIRIDIKWFHRRHLSLSFHPLSQALLLHVFLTYNKTQSRFLSAILIKTRSSNNPHRCTGKLPKTSPEVIRIYSRLPHSCHRSAIIVQYFIRMQLSLRQNSTSLSHI